MTRVVPASPSSRWCSGEYGSITPSSRAPGATAAATAAGSRRGASTIRGAGPPRRTPPPRREHDRALGPAQQRRGLLAQLDERDGRLHVGGHQRERLVLAV